MGRKIYEWNQDGEKAQNVDYEDYAFEMCKRFAANCIDDDRKGKYGPSKEHCLIRLRGVFRVAQ
jgi:hypothetical protein